MWRYQIKLCHLLVQMLSIVSGLFGLFLAFTTACFVYWMESYLGFCSSFPTSILDFNDEGDYGLDGYIESGAW